MHSDIELISQNKVTIKKGYAYRLACLDPPIHKEGAKLHKKRACTFKATKLSSMVGIGVCFRKKAEDQAYNFSAFSQHGCYLICHNGYTFN